MDGVKMIFLLQIFTSVSGKHLPKYAFNKEKSYRRQMIIPNKFIPMLKESALFKSRSSSNDLSDFLKPKSHEHDAEIGQTRQNLMNSLGMDSSQSQGMGGGGAYGFGGTDRATGMGGMGEDGGMGAMNQMGGTGGVGGMEGTVAMQGNGGLSDQSNGINEMGNSVAQQSPPMEGNQNGNGMNSMYNNGGQGMNADANNLPAGDPMGTLKDMLSSQATNSALGTNSEAFGPGGSANSNVLAMLNQIVGKEIPGESPVDPSSNQQQMWDQLQKNVDTQKPAGIPYIDSDNSKSAIDHAQLNTATPFNQTISAAAQPVVNAPVQTTRNLSTVNVSTIQSSTSNPSTASPASANPTAANPSSAHPSTKNPSTSNPAHSTKSDTKALHSEKESHTKALTQTTSNLPEVEAEEEDQPLSADMIKFLKGVKFVVSQEPGNDIILGKKFSSGIPPGVRDSLREENGVMKNVVSPGHKTIKNAETQSSAQDEKWSTMVLDDIGSKKATSSNTELIIDTRNKDFVEYVKAAKILERASKKLKDKVAKKSIEVAIASIIKVVALGKNKYIPSSNADLLNGGEVKNKLSEKYIEAARVLGTASRELADPVAKKSTEIGIASILKVIALGKYPTSKKTFVPGLYTDRLQLLKYVDALDHDEDKKYERVANNLDVAVRRTVKLQKFKKL